MIKVLLNLLSGNPTQYHLPKLPPLLGVQPRRRLVQKNDGHVSDEGHAQGAATSHATRQRADRLVLLLLEVDPLQDVLDLLFQPRAGHALEQPENFEVFVDGEDAPLDVKLRTQRYLFPDDFGPGFFAVDDHRALVRLQEVGYDRNEGGFAGAVGPQQPENLALFDLEVQPFEGREGHALFFVEFFDAAADDHVGFCLGGVHAVDEAPLALGGVVHAVQLLAVGVHVGLGHDPQTPLQGVADAGFVDDDADERVEYDADAHEGHGLVVVVDLVFGGDHVPGQVEVDDAAAEEGQGKHLVPDGQAVGVGVHVDVHESVKEVQDDGKDEPSGAGRGGRVEEAGQDERHGHLGGVPRADKDRDFPPRHAVEEPVIQNESAGKEEEGRADAEVDEKEEEGGEPVVGDLHAVDLEEVLDVFLFFHDQKLEDEGEAEGQGDGVEDDADQLC